MDNTVINLARVNSVLGMLNRISRATVRAKSPDNLYLEVCRIAVEGELFKYAWIGLIDSMTQQLKTLASWGESSRFSQGVSVDDELVESVLHSGEPCIATDTQGQTFFNKVSARGHHAVICLPLRDAGQVSGVFTLHVDQSGVFDSTVIGLLSDTAADISYALEHMESDQRRLAAEAKLHYRAFYDAQTGLPNRTMLEERLPALALHAQERGSFLSLIDIKLQRVDQILQILGNVGMDEVLRKLAQRLEQCRGDNSFVSQLAPDEFALVAIDLCDSSEVLALAEQVHLVLADAVSCGGKEIFVHASVGCAVFPVHESEVKYLLRRARAAADRTYGDIGVQLYTPDMDQGLEQSVEMSADLHRALERNEFILHYQPQLNMRTGTIVGVEALLRWQHPRRGIVSPALFIPLLEDSGLMPSVGTWVLRTACRQAKSWQEQGFTSLRMAVNLSAQQFRLADLVPTVKMALDDAGLEAEFLELELTESLILGGAERTIQTMHELKKLGVSLSLDDFGTGFSSLNYLRQYPVDRIKIDQSFIREMTEHAGSAALVRSILAMAENLGLTTIAEGVETIGQHGYLRKLLCKEMQGYLFSRPVAPQEVTRLLQDGVKLEAGEAAAQPVYTVLLVDDEPNILSSMKRVMRHESWQFLTASNAAEGFELLARHSIGVIISDQRMPGVSGTEFLHRVKEMYPDTVRILLTGYADFASVIEAVNQGDLYRVLRKPIDDHVLRENVREALHRYEIFAENHRLLARLAVLEDTQHRYENMRSTLG